MKTIRRMESAWENLQVVTNKPLRLITTISISAIPFMAIPIVLKIAHTV